MAAAIRSMPGKLGNRRSVADLVWHFEVRTLNNNNHELNLGYFSRRPLDYLSVENRPCNVRCPKKVEPKDQVIPYKLLGASLISRSSRYFPRIVIDAHFALEEFNKEKNAQMQYVRIVNAYTQRGGGWTYHFLTMDTIAPNNVIQMYQAIVKYHITGTPPELLLFGLVSDNGNGGLIVKTYGQKAERTLGTN